MIIKESIQLTTLRIEVAIAITPAPRRKKDGTYGLQPSQHKFKIHLEFKRDGLVFDKRGWNNLIGSKKGEAARQLLGGVLLSDDNLDEIDYEGWEIIGKYGIVPSVLSVRL